jgi:hypothetical protein
VEVPLLPWSKRLIGVQFLLLPLVLFVVIPARVLAENLEDFATFDPAAFLLLAATAFLATLVLLAFDRALARSPIRRYFSGLVEITVFFVLITGFLLPASTSGAMIDPEYASIDSVHVLIAAGLAYVLTIAAMSSLRRSLYLAVLAFVAVNTVLATPAVYSLVNVPATEALGPVARSIFELSNRRNILVLSFDGLPGPAVLEALQERPDLRDRLSDFTFYTGAASTSPGTQASIATSLYGNRNYKHEFATEDELWESAPDMLLTNRLDAAGWLVSTYGEYGRLLRRSDRAFQVLAPRPPPSALSLINYSLARSLTRHFVIGGTIAYQLDGLYSQALADLTGSDFDSASVFSSPHKPKWKQPLSATELDFADYVDKLRVVDSGPVAQFLHFTHTHFPIELDGECRWAGQDKSWYDTHQNFEGVKEQTTCALDQMADYLDKLRRLDAYDESLIILKSDHGEPVWYNDPATIESFRIRDHPVWGYGRYAPLLAIKDYGVTREAPLLNDQPVLLDDLARTICVRSRITVDCDWYNGVDVLGDQWTGIEKTEITMFIVADDTFDDTSDVRYDAHVPITFTRGSEILESLHSVLSDDLLRSSVSCGQQLRVAEGGRLDNGRSDKRSWLTWQDMGSSFLRLRLDQACREARLVVEADVDERTRNFRVSVNGEPANPSFSEGTPSGGETSEAVLDISSAMAGTRGDVVIQIQPLGPGQTNAVPIVGLDLD